MSKRAWRARTGPKIERLVAAPASTEVSAVLSLVSQWRRSFDVLCRLSTFGTSTVPSRRRADTDGPGQDSKAELSRTAPSASPTAAALISCVLWSSGSVGSSVITGDEAEDEAVADAVMEAPAAAVVAEAEAETTEEVADVVAAM